MSETLIAVSKDALDELVTQITALSAKVNNLTSEVERPVCLKDAAVHLVCSERQVHRLISMNSDFPAHKSGMGKLYFYLTELNEWLKTR